MLTCNLHAFHTKSLTHKQLIAYVVQVKYQQKYEQEIKGKASTDAGAAELTLAKGNAEKFSQVTHLLHLSYC